MTEKQQNILNHALTLFSTQGYDSTSTNKIAKASGVSEGLIFRHFKNKEGLLEAIMELGGERLTLYFSPILSEADPKKRIEKALRMPFLVPQNEYAFWKLMYSLKWQRGVYNIAIMDLLMQSLEDAFSALGYKHPVAEAKIMEITLDGIATVILLKGMENPTLILNQFLQKYNI